MNIYEQRAEQNLSGFTERQEAVDAGLRLYEAQKLRRARFQLNEVRVSGGIIRRRLVFTQKGE